ncbi:MAG: hypothetical protein JSW55_19820 [Chloroflexota bacterium]|nr:MAG: hypothetical protein JSW55_19820 [Chloroflexota bacterium]
MRFRPYAIRSTTNTPIIALEPTIEPATTLPVFRHEEVAHHSGILRKDALDVLHRLDQQFTRLEHAAELAARPYQFVVLSDHGQSQGATFKQRFGQSLEELVQSLIVHERELRYIGEI